MTYAQRAQLRKERLGDSTPCEMSRPGRQGLRHEGPGEWGGPHHCLQPLSCGGPPSCNVALVVNFQKGGPHDPIRVKEDLAVHAEHHSGFLERLQNAGGRRGQQRDDIRRSPRRGHPPTATKLTPPSTSGAQARPVAPTRFELFTQRGGYLCRRLLRLRGELRGLCHA